MKNLKKFIACLHFNIKKKFFKVEISDNYQVCEKEGDADVQSTSKNELEEYLKNYSGTTRWQTI